MHEVEQNSLLVEAKILTEEAAKAFFEGDTGRAADLAYTAFVQAGKVQDANPTRKGIDALMSRLDYIWGSLEHYFDNAEEWDV